MKNIIKEWSLNLKELFFKKIPQELIKMKDFLFYVLIFCIICNIYNLNNQTLNYILKRGVVLEYSINKSQTLDKKALQKKLLDMKFKYSYFDESLEDYYGANSNLVEKVIHIALPYLPKEDKKEAFNEVSDFIFDNYKGATLVDVKLMNENYAKPYASFMKFLTVLFVSFLIWIISSYFIYGNKVFKEKVIAFYNNKKSSLLSFIQKTKENGVGYFLRKIFLDESDNNEKETDITKEIISTIVFVLLCVMAIRYFIGELRWIPTGSMNPTILEKDRVYVEKLEFPKKEIKRGDILVFYPPEVELSNSPLAVLSRLSGIFCKDMAYIKRVIGMPGDKFEIKYDSRIDEYRVVINNKPLDEPYILSKVVWTPCENPDVKYCGPFVIPEDKYFMMGDNRGNSQDSRFWGFLDKDRIIGRANFMFFPFKRINVLTDKYLELNEQKIKGHYIKNLYIVNRY